MNMAPKYEEEAGIIPPFPQIDWNRRNGVPDVILTGHIQDGKWDALRRTWILSLRRKRKGKNRGTHTTDVYQVETKFWQLYRII